MPRIVPNRFKDLIGHARRNGTLLTDTTTTVYAVIRLEDDGGSDDGLYWDHGSQDWAAFGSVGTWPTALHVGNGIRVYELPQAAVITPGQRLHVSFSDNPGTPASETVYADEIIYDVVQDKDIGGTETFTVHTQDSSGNAIPYVKCSIVASGGSVTWTTDYTDEEGNLSIKQDGIKRVRAHKTGYSFGASQEITITDGGTGNIVGDAVSGADSPDGCLVYGTIRSGVVPLANATVRMTQVTRPGAPEVENSILMANVTQTTTTDASGYFELEMAAGTTIYVEIPECGIRHEITLDDVSTYDLSDEFD